MNSSSIRAQFSSRIRQAMFAVLGLLLVAVMPATMVCGAPLQDENDQRSELGARQELVVRRMAELEATLTQIANKIEQDEPERSKRLILAFQQAKEQLITQNMTEAIKLLDNEEYAQADEKLLLVIDNLDQLLRLLVNQKPKEMTREEEADSLQKRKEQLENIQSEQVKHTDETNKIANKDETLENLDAQIKALDNIIQAQREVMEETSENDGAGMGAMDRVADKQFDVRTDTEDLAQAVNENTAPKSENKPGEGEDKPGEGEGKPGEGEGKPGEGEGKPGEGEGKPGEGEGKPGEGEGKPGEGEGKPGEGEGKPGEGEGKPGEGEGKPGEGQSGEGQSGEGQSGEGQSGDCLLYTSPSPRDRTRSRMPSSA